MDRRENLFVKIFQPDRDSRVAIVYEHREINYAELRDETMRVAHVLNASGVQNNDRVAVLLADSPEFVVSVVAIISIGAIAVPINLALSRDEQLFILQDCGARAAIIEAQVAKGLLDNTAAPPQLKQVIVVSREAGERLLNFSGIETRDFSVAEHIPWNAAGGYNSAADANADAFILYTSGSTGEPKGAVHSQADIFYTSETYCREVLQLREGDRLFSSSRLPFAYGFGNALTFPLLNGFTSILCREKPTAELISRIFVEYRPTIFFGVPVVYRMLLEHYRAAVRIPTSVGSSRTGKGPTEVGTLNTSSLRLCISAGEALPAQLGNDWQETFGVEVLDGIGSTEMLHMFISNHSGHLRYGSSGDLLRGYEARLVDHEGTPTPAGEVGNLWIRGRSAASRYWQRPEISAQTFVADWVRTGDLYRCDGEGFWWHMGRSDDCFKPTGQWVSPIEVENVLLRHSSVRAAAVVEGLDEDALSCVCAFVVAFDVDSGQLEQELRDVCGAALPRFKQPKRYLFVPKLPYTATGKIQRFKLREQLRAQRAK